MKKNLMIVMSMMALLLAGCGVKPYVDVQSDDYATLQLIYKGDAPGSFIVYIEDFSNGCKKAVQLGKVVADKNTRTKSVKIPVEVPLWMSVNYVENSFNSSYADTEMFVLTPEKNKHYVVDYMRKEIDFFNSIGDLDVYMIEEGEQKKIPTSRKRAFKSALECG